MDEGLSLCLKPNVMDIGGPCAVCGRMTHPGEVDCFLEGSYEIVCPECVSEMAPELYALQRAQRATPHGFPIAV